MTRVDGRHVVALLKYLQARGLPLTYARHLVAALITRQRGHRKRSAA